MKYTFKKGDVVNTNDGVFQYEILEVDYIKPYLKVKPLNNIRAEQLGGYMQTSNRTQFWGWINSLAPPPIFNIWKKLNDE